MSPRFPRIRYRTMAGGSGSTGSTGSTSSTGPVDITGVSGSFADGQTVTVSGANLMNLRTSGWFNFFSTNLNRHSFEGLSDGSTIGALGYAVPGDGRGGGQVDTSVSVLGSACVRFRSTSPGSTTASGQNYNYILGTNSEGWLATYVRWNRVAPVNSWANSAHKWIEFPFAVYYLQPIVAGLSSGQNPSGWTLYNTASGSHEGTMAVPHTGSSIVSSRWYHFAWHMIRSSTPGQSLCEVWIDGRQMLNIVPTASTVTLSEVLFGTINAVNAPTASTHEWDVETRMDGFVCGSTRIWPFCQVELADSSDYDSANKIWQETLSISDTQVQFVFNSTGITIDGGTTGLAGAERWVFLTNQARERSSGHQVA